MSSDFNDVLRERIEGLVESRLSRVGSAIESAREEIIEIIDRVRDATTSSEAASADRPTIEQITAEINAQIGQATAESSRLGGDLALLRDSVVDIDNQATQADVLTVLVQRASSFAPRVILFVVKSGNAIAWAARGFQDEHGDDAVRGLSVSLASDTLLGAVLTNQKSYLGEPGDQAENAALIDKLGSISPERVSGIPLRVRSKTVGILYADSYDTSVSSIGIEALELLVHSAGIIVELASLRQRIGEPMRSAPEPTHSAPLTTSQLAHPVEAAEPVEAHPYVEEADAEPESTSEAAEMTAESIELEVEAASEPEVAEPEPAEVESAPEAEVAEPEPAEAEAPWSPEAAPEAEAPWSPEAAPDAETEPESVDAEVEAEAEAYAQPFSIEPEGALEPEAVVEVESAEAAPTAEAEEEDVDATQAYPAAPLFAMPSESESYGGTEPDVYSGSGAAPFEFSSDVSTVEPEPEAEVEPEYEITINPDEQPAPSAEAASPFDLPLSEAAQEAPSEPAFLPPDEMPTMQWRPEPGAFDQPVVVPAPAPTAGEMSPEEEKLHSDARRFARLLVSEIKLYNEQQVAEGRTNNDLYQRLKDDIDRSRQMYDKRVAAVVAERFDYFYDELVSTLAEGDPGKLGPDYPGASV